MQDAAFDLHGPEERWPAAVAAVSLVGGHPHIVLGVADPLGRRRARFLAGAAATLYVSQSVTVRGVDTEGVDSASDCRSHSVSRVADVEEQTV